MRTWTRGSESLRGFSVGWLWGTVRLGVAMIGSVVIFQTASHWQPAVSEPDQYIFAVIVGATIQLVLEAMTMRYRLAQEGKERKVQLAAFDSKVERFAKSIDSRLDKIEGTTAAIELVGKMATLPPGLPEVVRARIVARFGNHKDLLTDMSGGSCDYAGEDRDLLLTLTDVAKSSIDAVSTELVDAVRFWNSELGRTYLNRQQLAITSHRQVEVRRVFVSHCPDGKIRADMIDIMDRQCLAGVKVHHIDQATFDRLFPNGLTDSIVFDNGVVYQTQIAQGGVTPPPISGIHLTWRQQDLETAMRTFEKLWGVSVEYVSENVQESNTAGTRVIPQRTSSEDQDPVDD